MIGEDSMNVRQAPIDFVKLTNELILAASTKEKDCTKEELYFALNCLLRSFHTVIDEDSLSPHSLQYIQNQFCSMYKIITGRTIYPF